MSKMLKQFELSKIIDAMCNGDEVDDADVYSRFLVRLGDLITDFCGGVTGCASYDADCGWLVSFSATDSLPPDGGIFKDYDPDVTWKDGEEDQDDA